MAYKKQRKYKKRGVPPGYKHVWRYKGVWREKKLPGGTWKISFKATKGKKSHSYGQFKKGFKVVWKIKGIQTAEKIAPGRYQTHLIATKKRIKSGYKRRKQ